MDHFPNLPRDPAPPAPARPAPAAATAAAAKAAKSARLMYVWIGLAVASFGGIAYWGMLRPSPTDADVAPHQTYIPEVKTAAQRAEDDRLADMVKRLREQEASRIIVLDGARGDTHDAAPKSAAPVPAPEMFIRFKPSTQPATRPATIGGRTKPFLAPDVAEDGSYFGQIDKATGKPKTVYYSNLGKYVVEDGTDAAKRDASGAVMKKTATPSAARDEKHDRPVRTQTNVSSSN
jgi:hypothetical protein